MAQRVGHVADFVPGIGLYPVAQVALGQRFGCSLGDGHGAAGAADDRGDQPCGHRADGRHAGQQQQQDEPRVGYPTVQMLGQRCERRFDQLVLDVDVACHGVEVIQSGRVQAARVQQLVAQQARSGVRGLHG